MQVFTDVSSKTMAAVNFLLGAAADEDERIEYWDRCARHWTGDWYEKDCMKQRDMAAALAAQYREWAELFRAGTPPGRPDLGERPSWFPPYQEGTIWVTTQYPQGVPERVQKLATAWNLYLHA